MKQGAAKWQRLLNVALNRIQAEARFAPELANAVLLKRMLGFPAAQNRSPAVAAQEASARSARQARAQAAAGASPDGGPPPRAEVGGHCFKAEMEARATFVTDNPSSPPRRGGCAPDSSRGPCAVGSRGPRGTPNRKTSSSNSNPPWRCRPGRSCASPSPQPRPRFQVAAGSGAGSTQTQTYPQLLAVEELVDQALVGVDAAQRHVAAAVSAGAMVA